MSNITLARYAMKSEFQDLALSANFYSLTTEL